jgi:hypothetical protein
MSLFQMCENYENLSVALSLVSISRQPYTIQIKSILYIYILLYILLKRSLNAA